VIPAPITAICRAHFGRYLGGGKWSPPNRCDSCPLRDPCMRKGAAPARTLEELAESRAAFVAAAEAIIAGGAR
jgi:hypothetical protein